MDVNFDLMKNAFPLLVAGAGITIEITALSVFFGNNHFLFFFVHNSFRLSFN